MFTAASLIADALGRHLSETYMSLYGGEEPRYARILESAGRLVIERIANSGSVA
jgi:hypothetical protein